MCTLVQSNGKNRNILTFQVVSFRAAKCCNKILVLSVNVTVGVLNNVYDIPSLQAAMKAVYRIMWSCLVCEELSGLLCVLCVLWLAHCCHYVVSVSFELSQVFNTCIHLNRCEPTNEERAKTHDKVLCWLVFRTNRLFWYLYVFCRSRLLE